MQGRNIINVVIRKLWNFPRKLRYWFYVKFNRLYFKIQGAEIGSNFSAYNHIDLFVNQNAKLKIGNDFLFISGESYNPLSRNIRGCMCLNSNASLVIGNNVGISSACIWVHKSIIIGNNVKIGGDCILLDSDCHSLDYVERRISEIDLSHKNDREIVINDDVLIGTHCIILKGVHIGARSIIGSGSVVTKDIPADCIAAGNPCRVIRFFDNKLNDV